jgi:hypothetical protein
MKNHQSAYKNFYDSANMLYNQKGEKKPLFFLTPFCMTCIKEHLIRTTGCCSGSLGNPKKKSIVNIENNFDLT